ncbi:MAG TPA: dTMP kinase [Melioribacteraceae bacterium]|nr:dTMP kinase [Melioribacteraceae bacterium]
MYIALEGVKGSGKSTLIKALCNYFKKHGITFKLACPTAQSSIFNLLELTAKLFPKLRKYDRFNEYLYATRSNLTALKIFNYSGLILGDRSIVTSYAYRWNKWIDKKKFVNRVNKLEFLIPAPDFIIYLDIDAKESVNRINRREKRSYGLKDESYMGIKEVLASYKEIVKQPIVRIKNTIWYIINANNDFDFVFNECVMFINNKIELTTKEAKYEY